MTDMRRAMVLAAGLGTRLGALTNAMPKCLIEVGGQSMLGWVLGRLVAAGVREVIVNLHHHPDQIRDHLTRHKGFGARIEYSTEPSLLGTGGGLKQAADFFKNEEVFIVHNADVYCELSLQALANSLASRTGAVAALATQRRATSRALLFDGSGLLVGWEGNKREVHGGIAHGVSAPERDVVREVPSVDRLAFAGIQALTRRIFEFMSEDSGAFSIIRTYMRAARAGAVVCSHSIDDSYWIDMGSPATLEDLRAYLAQSGIRGSS